MHSTENGPDTKLVTPKSDLSNVDRLAVKLPPVWRKNIATRFVQIEAQFACSGITAESTRFHYAVAALGPDTVDSIIDFLRQPLDTGLGESNILSSGSGRNIPPVSTALGTTVAQAPPSSGPRECAGCGKRITERFLLKAIDLFWHEDCLKCGCCDCRLGEVGSTLYTKANLILCKRDYLRLFGTTGYCAACNKVIPAFEMVMRAKSNVYHLECFACQQCNHRFCVGDRFYLCDNKILCEYDYEERLVFANMAYNPSNLAHIRRQVGNLQSAGNNLTHSFGQGPLPTGQTTFNVPSFEKTSTAASSSAGSNVSNHLNPPHSIRDDGSSGYGSPDSETFDPQ